MNDYDDPDEGHGVIVACGISLAFWAVLLVAGVVL